MKITFASINRQGIAYQYDDSGGNTPLHFYRRINEFVGQNCWEYETYDHGLVQHSPLSLALKDHFVDFYLSMATYLAENSPRKSIYPVFVQINPEKIRFLAKIRYKEGKRQFFDLENRKLSRAKSKEYDKRYEEVPEGFKGSVKDIFCAVRKDYWNIGDCITVIKQIREALNWQWFDTETLLGLTDDQWREMSHIIDIVQDLVESYRLQENAISRLKLATKQFQKAA